jgi:hypothetical protein
MKDSMNMHTWLDSAQPRGEWSNPLTADKGDLNPNSVEEKTIPAP